MLIKDISFSQSSKAHTHLQWFPMLRYFSWLALASIVVCAIALCVLFRFVSVNNLISAGENSNTVLAKSLMNAIWDDYVAYLENGRGILIADAESTQRFARLHSLVLRNVKSLPVLQVNIYGMDEKVVFSTQQSTIGSMASDVQAVRNVAQSGDAQSELNFRKQFASILGDLDERHVLSTMVPAYKPQGSDVQAVMEIFYDVSAMLGEIESQQKSVFVSVTVILSLLYMVLFFIVRRGDYILKQQHTTLASYLKQSEVVNENLEERVQARTQELQVVVEELEKYKTHLESLVNMRTTELQKARDEALDASKAKSVFLANMSHELRTPLNAVIGYAELLRDQPYDEEIFKNDLQKIFNSGNHLLQLINDILDISKIEAGRMDNYIEPMQVNSTVQEVLASVSNLIRKKGNILKFEPTQDMDWINADITKFRQVLFNLISNANKFTENGEIKVELKLSYDDFSKRWLKMSVTDSGIGISDEKLQKIFDSFTQADDSTSRHYGGTGLGLAISQRLCELLGGKITVNSQPNVGSTFIVWLPLDQDCSHAHIDSQALAIGPKVDPRKVRFGSDTSAQAHRRSKISTVLVIDDDADVRDLMERFLTREGYNVYSAANADEGLVMAAVNKPDVITLDILMPEKDGLTVLREFKRDSELKDIPVIIITLAGDKDVCMSLGADEYLCKPVDWDVLSKIMSRSMRKTKRD